MGLVKRFQLYRIDRIFNCAWSFCLCRKQRRWREKWYVVTINSLAAKYWNMNANLPYKSSAQNIEWWQHCVQLDAGKQTRCRIYKKKLHFIRSISINHLTQIFHVFFFLLRFISPSIAFIKLCSRSKTTTTKCTTSFVYRRSIFFYLLVRMSYPFSIYATKAANYPAHIHIAGWKKSGSQIQTITKSKRGHNFYHIFYFSFFIYSMQIDKQFQCWRQTN